MPDRVNGRGGMVAISAGTPTEVPAPPAWAAGTEYVLDDVVTVGSGQTAVQAICTNGHTSAASGLEVSGGALSGGDMGNWKLIANGTITALRNWSYSTTESTTTTTYCLDEADRTTGTSLTTTGTLTFDDDDAEDVAQKALGVGNQATLTLYPKGLGTGKPQFTGTARFTQSDQSFSTETQQISVNFAIQGSWTRSDQA